MGAATVHAVERGVARTRRSSSTVKTAQLRSLSLDIPLLVAGVLTLAFAFLRLQNVIGCPTYFTELRNVVDAVLVLSSGAALVILAPNPSNAKRLTAQVPAGLVAGMHANPSLGLLVSISVIALAIAAALPERRALSLAMLVAGCVVGFGVMILLSGPFPPSTSRC